MSGTSSEIHNRKAHMHRILKLSYSEPIPQSCESTYDIKYSNDTILYILIFQPGTQLHSLSICIHVYASRLPPPPPPPSSPMLMTTSLKANIVCGPLKVTLPSSFAAISWAFNRTHMRSQYGSEALLCV